MQQCTSPCTVLSPQLEHCSIVDELKYQSSRKEPFTIVFNLSSVKENELTIEFPEENILKLRVHHTFRKVGRLDLERDCVYLYRLPEKIQKHNLTATWTNDNYLIIKELEKKNISVAEDSACNKPEKFQSVVEPETILENKPLIDKNSGKSIETEDGSFRLIPEKSRKKFQPSLAQFELTHHIKNVADEIEEVKIVMDQAIETSSELKFKRELKKEQQLS